MRLFKFIFGKVSSHIPKTSRVDWLDKLYIAYHFHLWILFIGGAAVDEIYIFCLYTFYRSRSVNTGGFGSLNQVKTTPGNTLCVEGN